MKISAVLKPKRKVAEVDAEFLNQVLAILKIIPACPVHGMCLPHCKRWIKRRVSDDKAYLRGVLKKVEHSLGSAFYEANRACNEDIKKLLKGSV